jgi:coenzyme F420-reducing hydrogenase gamma subunit
VYLQWEDWDFWLNFHQTVTVQPVYVRRPLFLYSSWGKTGSMVRSILEKNMNHLETKVINDLIAWLKQRRRNQQMSRAAICALGSGLICLCWRICLAKCLLANHAQASFCGRNNEMCRAIFRLANVKHYEQDMVCAHLGIILSICMQSC